MMLKFLGESMMRDDIYIVPKSSPIRKMYKEKTSAVIWRNLVDAAISK